MQARSSEIEKKNELYTINLNDDETQHNRRETDRSADRVSNTNEVDSSNNRLSVLKNTLRRVKNVKISDLSANDISSEKKVDFEIQPSEIDKKRNSATRVKRMESLYKARKNKIHSICYY